MGHGLEPRTNEQWGSARKMGQEVCSPEMTSGTSG